MYEVSWTWKTSMGLEVLIAKYLVAQFFLFSNIDEFA